jgi:GxxExxY protein
MTKAGESLIVVEGRPTDLGNSMEDAALKRLTERVIGCVYRVSNALGIGFLEKVYENSLAVELRNAGLLVEQQRRCTIRYRGQIVGEYVADLVVEGRVLVEPKVCKAFEDAHTAQCLNFLKASGLVLCLLVNFGQPKAQIRRLRLGRPADEGVDPVAGQ